MPPPGARGPAYIVPPNEYGPLDQTDLNRTVFLNPLGRWSIIREMEPDWPWQQGGCPRGEGGCPVPGPARRLHRDINVSCNFLSSRRLQKPRQRTGGRAGVGCIWVLFSIYLLIIFDT